MAKNRPKISFQEASKSVDFQKQIEAGRRQSSQACYVIRGISSRCVRLEKFLLKNLFEI